MAGKGKTSETAENRKSVEDKKSNQQSSVYTVKEFADQAVTLFGVRQECVIAALKSAGITSCTLLKAKEIVKSFMRKEVQ